MIEAKYQRIHQYEIHGICTAPLHVGGTAGATDEVLLRPTDHMPFIPATGIAGVLRSYSARLTTPDVVDRLFGDAVQDIESRIRITDGEFTDKSKLQFELRPRITISRETGTVSAEVGKGTDDKVSGQYRNMMYLGAGATFVFTIYLYDATEMEEELFVGILAAMHHGRLQFGGQRSTGGGYIGIENVLHRTYDLRQEADRKDWAQEKGLILLNLDKLNRKDPGLAYEITVRAETESELLIKGIAVEQFAEDAPAVVNMKNAAGTYIIPGSSIKGAIRQRMEMIADYMKLPAEVLESAFGRRGEGAEEGRMGSLYFRDVLLDQSESGSTREHLRTRIHIDKFTGGVISGGTFSELSVFGDLEIRMTICGEGNLPAVTGLLLLAIRDLAQKKFALGGGQSIGRGYLNIQEVRLTQTNSAQVCVLGNQLQIQSGRALLETCMKALDAGAAC